MSAPRIGVALGGGGARGLAHIAILEAFDELGIRPHRMAGTSMGALVGAAYASGLPARELREHAQDTLANRVTACPAPAFTFRRQPRGAHQLRVVRTR